MANSEVFIILANLMSKEGILNSESKEEVDELLKHIKNKNIKIYSFAVGHIEMTQI